MFFLISRKFPDRFACLKTVVLVFSFFVFLFSPDNAHARKSSYYPGKYSKTYSGSIDKHLFCGV